MSKKKHQSTVTLLAVFIVLALLVYSGYQIYRSIFSGIKTELAVQASVYESIEAEGLIFRTETVIPDNTNGHVYYTVQNGARVAKNGVIASVYSSENDGLLMDQIREIDASIEVLQTLQANDTSLHLTLDIIDTQLKSTLNTMINDAADAVFHMDADTRLNLLSLLSKKRLIAGEKADFSTEIARLQQKRTELKSKYHAAISEIKAPVAGYFTDSADGYEELLSSVDPTTLTVGELQGLLDTSVVAVPACTGKIVGGYEWFFACVVPDAYYNTFSVGNELALRMSFVSDDEIPVKVASCQKDNQGNMAVVFRCAYMSEKLSDIRKETAQLLMVRHSGLKVPKRAIVINDNMEAGVYIRSGNIAAFRKIKQLYSEPADYVICELTEQSGYLHLYDDIIVSGKGLYDGKAIS